LECNDAAIAKMTRQSAYQCDWLRGKEQNATTNDCVEVTLQLDRSRIPYDK
jgi:hypothetical protein